MIKRWYLRRLRESQGLSYQYLADVAMISVHSLWNMENIPGYNAQIRSIQLLANYFNVHIHELIEDTSVLTYR